MDTRYQTLAENIVSHSISLKPGEKVFLHSFDVPDEMLLSLIRAVRAHGGIPFAQVQHARIDRELIKEGEEIQFETSLEWGLQRMKKMDAYVALRGSSNVFENSDLSSEDLQRAMRIHKPILDWRVKRQNGVC